MTFLFRPSNFFRHSHYYYRPSFFFSVMPIIITVLPLSFPSSPFFSVIPAKAGIQTTKEKHDDVRYDPTGSLDPRRRQGHRALQSSFASE